MINVNVVSGFLGAGKTTFIKRLLKAYEGRKVVLLENEFGEIGIDAQIVEGDGFDVVELSSGCICCSMKIDFEKAIVKIAQQLQPERILIEPTGVGMLSEIKGIMKKESISGLCKLESCTTIVDAVDYIENLDAFGEFFKDQIAGANTVVLSKVQETDRQAVADVIESIRGLNQLAPVIDEDWKDIEDIEFAQMVEGSFGKKYSKLFKMDFEIAVDSTCSCSCSCHGHDHEHSNPADGLMSVSVIPDLEMDASELGQKLKALSQGGLGRVIRAKGFVPGIKEPLEFSYVNGRYCICGNSKAQSPRLCVIGRELDEQGIRSMFQVADYI